MIYRRVVKRVIISRENLKELTFEDVSLRGTRHRFRNRVASVFPRLETGIRENTIGRFRFFFFFPFETILRDFNRETVGVEAKRGEIGNNVKTMPLFKGMSVRRDFIAGNERILDSTS